MGTRSSPPVSLPTTTPTDHRQPTARAPRAAIALALAVAVFVLLGKGIGSAPFTANSFMYPFQLDDAEGVVLAEATLIAEGINPYAYQPSPAPYFHAGPYPPVYTLINAVTVATVGPSFKVGRAVQFLATLGVGLWLTWAVAWPRRSLGWIPWFAGAWVALLWLTAHLVVVWSVLIRPDMTALALNLLGVVVLRRWWDARGRGTEPDHWPRGRVLVVLALGAACFALGWWTKQTFIAVPGAFLLTLLGTRPRTAVTLAALYALLITLPFVALTALTGGGFAQKTIAYQGSWEWEAFRQFAVLFAARYGVWLLVALFVAVLCCVRERRPTFAAVWFALAGIAALGAGTSGGNHNHFVELLAAAALLTGQGVAEGLRQVTTGDGRAWRTAAGVGVAVLLLTGVGAFEHEGRYGWLAREYTAPTAEEREGMTAVASYLTNTPGPVYSDNVGILVVARQPVRVTDPFTMAAEVRLGRWDDADLVAAVASGKFSVIAVREKDFERIDPEHPPTDMTPALVRAIQARYRLAERNVLSLYVPK